MKDALRAMVAVLAGAMLLQPGSFFLKGGQRVVFLGDSITQDGRYVEAIEAWLIEHRPRERFEIIKLGLSSETVEGLTEPDHPYPRPNVHDRLESALRLAAPAVVVACYGMNDGIYHPFSQERFEAFQSGVRRLVGAVRAAGATAVLMTPPPFDPVAAKATVVGADASRHGYRTPYRHYDSEVLRPYSLWLLGLRREGILVIDSRGPMVAALEKERRKDPSYKLARDGVHPDLEGHWIMAAAVLEAWGARRPRPPRPDVLTLIHEKWQVLGPAWLARVGHLRSPVRVDFETAKALADELDYRTRLLVSR